MTFATNQVSRLASESPAVGDRALRRKLRTTVLRVRRHELADAIEVNGHHAWETEAEQAGSNRNAWWSIEKIVFELDRIGVSLRTAGIAFGVTAADLGDEVEILGPPVPHGQRRRWRGSHVMARELLEELPDGAGDRSFWSLFGRHRS